MTAGLPKPEPEEVIHLTVTLTTPFTFTTPNGTSLTYDPRRVTATMMGTNSFWHEDLDPGYPPDPDYYNRTPRSRGCATFIVKGTDAPPAPLEPRTQELPTLTAR